MHLAANQVQRSSLERSNLEFKVNILKKIKYKICPRIADPGTNPICLNLVYLHAGQPINGDGTAGGVAPELDELLDGEDTSEVLNASAILGMASLELVVGHWISGDPADVGNADDVAVQVGFEDTCATRWAAINIHWPRKCRIEIENTISSCLDLRESCFRAVLPLWTSFSYLDYLETQYFNWHIALL